MRRGGRQVVFGGKSVENQVLVGEIYQWTQNIMDPRLPARIADKIIPEPNTGCWLWVGCLTSGGYGQLHDNGETEYAHRYVFKKLKRKLQKKRQIDHLCRVR